jgi:hypothetical protein
MNMEPVVKVRFVCASPEPTCSIRIENIGPQSVYDLRIKWVLRLVDHDGEEISALANKNVWQKRDELASGMTLNFPISIEDIERAFSGEVQLCMQPGTCMAALTMFYQS